MVNVVTQVHIWEADDAVLHSHKVQLRHSYSAEE